jgi:hypothetical protein
MNGFMTSRPAVLVAAAFTTLMVAAPAAAKKPAKDDKPVKTPATVSDSVCPDRIFDTVFSDFRDSALYTLAPDGDFEAGAAGWTLGDGAAVSGESSSILLGSALGAQALSLEDGASATTPPICVEKGFPSFRFVTRAAGGAKRSGVRVEVLYASGKVKKAGRVKAASAWRVTRKVSLAQGRFRTARGQSAEVQLRFTAFGGPVHVDDVYVDPRLRR